MTISLMQWYPSYSKVEAMLNASEHCKVILENGNGSWGYFLQKDGGKIIVGYNNIGLEPQSLQCNGMIFVGINDKLFGVNEDSLSIAFSYKMPWIFYEFIKYTDHLLVRDEIGFVIISNGGQEIWSATTESPIGSYSMQDDIIRGSTIDGDEFVIKMSP